MGAFPFGNVVVRPFDKKSARPFGNGVAHPFGNGVAHLFGNGVVRLFGNGVVCRFGKTSARRCGGLFGRMRLGGGLWSIGWFGDCLSRRDREGRSRFRCTGGEPGGWVVPGVSVDRSASRVTCGVKGLLVFVMRS